MPSPISTIGKSLIRHANDLVDEINATNLNQSSVQYWSWETRSEEDKLPKTTLFGLDDFSFMDNTGLWHITCGFGLSSYQDPNLHNELEMLDIIYDKCSQGKKITLLDPLFGDELDQLVVVEFEITPMVQSQLRNYRTVNLALRRTSSALT